jgi:hypothetical protein
MNRRPLATVRVLRRPDLAPDAVRVEIDCRYSRTGLTSIPSEALRLTVPMLVTSACYLHEERCNRCDTTEAHALGDQRVRDWTEAMWPVMQDTRIRRHMTGRRN